MEEEAPPIKTPKLMPPVPMAIPMLQPFEPEMEDGEIEEGEIR
jgi:hypothetical protein